MDNLRYEALRTVARDTFKSRSGSQGKIDEKDKKASAYPHRHRRISRSCLVGTIVFVFVAGLSVSYIQTTYQSLEALRNRGVYTNAIVDYCYGNEKGGYRVSYHFNAKSSRRYTKWSAVTTEGSYLSAAQAHVVRIVYDARDPSDSEIDADGWAQRSDPKAFMFRLSEFAGIFSIILGTCAALAVSAVPFRSELAQGRSLHTG